MENQQHKRQWRELEDATRERISRSMKGRHFSALHKSRLSASLKKYWEAIPNRRYTLVAPFYQGVRVA